MAQLIEKLHLGLWIAISWATNGFIRDTVEPGMLKPEQDPAAWRVGRQAWQLRLF